MTTTPSLEVYCIYIYLLPLHAIPCRYPFSLTPPPPPPPPPPLSRPLHCAAHISHLLSFLTGVLKKTMSSLRYTSGANDQRCTLDVLFGNMSALSSSSSASSKTGTAGGGEGKGGVGSKLGLKIGAVLKKGKTKGAFQAGAEKLKKKVEGTSAEGKVGGVGASIASAVSGDHDGSGGGDHRPDMSNWSFLTRLVVDLLHPQGLYQTCVRELVRGQTNGRWESVVKRGVGESNGEVQFHLIVSGNRVGVKNGLHRGARYECREK